MNWYIVNRLYRTYILSIEAKARAEVPQGTGYYISFLSKSPRLYSGNLRPSHFSGVAVSQASWLLTGNSTTSPRMRGGIEAVRALPREHRKDTPSVIDMSPYTW